MPARSQSRPVSPSLAAGSMCAAARAAQGWVVSRAGRPGSSRSISSCQMPDLAGLLGHNGLLRGRIWPFCPRPPARSLLQKRGLGLVGGGAETGFRPLVQQSLSFPHPFRGLSPGRGTRGSAGMDLPCPGSWRQTRACRLPHRTRKFGASRACMLPCRTLPVLSDSAGSVRHPTQGSRGG